MIITLGIFQGSYEAILYTLIVLYLLAHWFMCQDCNQSWHTKKCNPIGFGNPIESCNPIELSFVIEKDYRTAVIVNWSCG